MNDIFDREIPALPVEIEESISSTDIVCRLELALVIGFAQGAKLPPRIIERLFKALEASDRLLVDVTRKKDWRA